MSSSSNEGGSPMSSETSMSSPKNEREAGVNRFAVDGKDLCAICQVEPSTVFYLRTPTCTGCRAFFRRSIKQQKKYRCLQGRLCGQNSRVPTRRACKYCRFQRCVEAGMLESKLLMHSEERRQISAFSKKIPAITSSIFMSDAIGEVLRNFTQIRRQTRFEFFSCYEREFPEMCKGSEGWISEPRESPAGTHDMKLSHVEFHNFNRIATAESSLFHGIDKSEWSVYSNDFCSQYFHLFNRALATVRFNGHTTKRSYNIDGSYLNLNEDITRGYWSFIMQGIEPDSREAIYACIHDFMFGCAQHLINQVSRRVAEAHLDEIESSALLFLLFTSPECLACVSERTAEQLRSFRQQAIRELATYIHSTGREVSGRLASIIFLTSEFHSVRKLANHVLMLIFQGTQSGVLPDDFRKSAETQVISRSFPTSPM
ncbi:hypothetical protein M3Y99_01835800 [Aphelenchoides fujianensis]|nr:hypothetical protein M3Y99_01835800 [Aphelenchoides fujianensis]